MGATSNLTQIKLIAETIPGQTPTTGASQALRFTSESLEYNITTAASEEIRADRMTPNVFQTGADASGDINFELSYGTYDDLIAAALGSAWATNAVKIGSNRKSFSVEVGFTDIAMFLNYRGMQVNGFNLSFEQESAITGSISLMGMDRDHGKTTFQKGSTTPATTTDVMETVSGFADMKVAGVAVACDVSSLTLAVNGNLRARKAVGKLGACEILQGRVEVTGDLVVYFKDGALFDKQVANEPFSLEWTAQDRAGNKYQFVLHRLKVTNATVNAGGLDQDVELTVSYMAERDPTANTLLTITRVPASPPSP